MKILAQIPLLLFVLITYCIVALASPEWLNIEPPIDAEMAQTESIEDSESVFSPNVAKPIFVMKLVSGATWGLTFGEMLILIALILLFIEIFKSTRTSMASIVDHMLSTFVFIIFLVLFLIWDRAGTGVFFILSTITMIDVMCGFTVSISTARRDVSFGAN